MGAAQTLLQTRVDNLETVVLVDHEEDEADDCGRDRVRRLVSMTSACRHDVSAGLRCASFPQVRGFVQPRGRKAATAERIR